MPRRPKWFERLVAARTGKISAELRRSVLRGGDGAVPLLVEVLSDDRRWRDSRMSVDPLVQAIVLLGEVATPEAAKALVAALAHAKVDTGLHHLTVETRRGLSLETLRAARLARWDDDAPNPAGTLQGRDVLSDAERRLAIVSEPTRPLLPPKLPKGFDSRGQPE